MAMPHITTGGKEYVQDAATLLSAAFDEDPTITYILSSLTSEERDAYRPKFFSALLTAAAMNAAVFHEANGWESCGVLMPPGCKVDSLTTLLPAGFVRVAWNLGIGGMQRMLRELSPATAAVKAKTLKKGEKYYYVFFLGTREDGRGKGLCSAIVKRYQELAKRDGVPIYMEAATEYCWGLYKKLGFMTVEEIWLGKGKASADGTQNLGGPGFKIWGMIWRPEQSE